MKKATKTQQRAKATLRKAARRAAIKSGTVKKGDKKDVDHKKPLCKGGTNAKSNLRVISRKKNRAAGGKIGGKMVTGAKKIAAGKIGGLKSSRKGIKNKK